MLRIGLTGGIGSGKSRAAALFAEHGAAVIDTDLIAREVVEPGSPALKEVGETFGPGVLQTDGRLDRSALRARVFADEKARLRLEAILHPRIREAMLAAADSVEAPYLIFVVPLLLEQGWDELVDRVLVVDCTTDQQLERAMQRDRLGASQVRAIMATQLGREERLRRADDICHNDGDLAQLQAEVERLHRFYLSLAE